MMSPHRDDVQPRLREALNEIRQELATLAEHELESINLEPLSAIATVCGALPQLLAQRDEILSTLPRFAPQHLDRLEIYALAFMAAHSEYCAARGLQKDPASLASRTARLRKQLLLDVTFLGTRGLLPQATTIKLKGAVGYLNIACDVMTLASLLRHHWKKVAGYCACTSADLDQAEILSDNLIRAVGERSPIPEAVTEAALLRQQAFTLFIRAYTEVRAAVVYLRRHTRDAERIAPSLYRKSSGKTKSVTSEPSLEVASDARDPEATACPDPTGTSVQDSQFDPFTN